MSAILSPCGTFRYRLERELQEAGFVVAFFGVNAATADAEIPDQTDMKWRGFGRAMGARRYIAGNPFAFRATEVRDLAAATDPVGPENAVHIAQIIRDADLLVPCWGARGKLPRHLRHHLDDLAACIFASGKPVKTFGFTKSGDPKHPLMLGYKTQLVDWCDLL